MTVLVQHLSRIHCHVGTQEPFQCHSHLEFLMLDNEWFAVPGAKGFAHLGVGGVGTVRSVGITLFEV